MTIYNQINKKLINSNKIFLATHQNPDGDALGSIGAMAEFLRQSGKHPILFCPTPPSAHLSFLPHSQHISSDPASLQPDTEVIVVLDSGDLAYAGLAEMTNNHPALIINIDHHASNTNYGQINLVNHSAASTTQILYDLFSTINIKINKDMATSLLTGIITDTDSFTNAATNTTSLSTAGNLLRAGANLNTIHRQTAINSSISTLKLWGIVLERLTKIEENDIVYTYINREDYLALNATESDIDGISNFLNKLSESRIALFMKETSDGNIKASFRTTRDDVDVSVLAKKFNGGGHKKAAGFTAPGTINEVLQLILTADKDVI